MVWKTETERLEVQGSLGLLREMGKISSQNNELKMDSAAERLSRTHAVLGSTLALRKEGKSERDMTTERTKGQRMSTKYLKSGHSLTKEAR